MVNDEKDLALLKVNGSKGKDVDKEYVKKLANAILQTFSKHDVARLRCVGAAAINNADKAIIIASGEADKRGIELVEKKSFTIAYFGDNGEIEKTGILKEIVKR
jgi:stage V sporulation protein SpoVS